MYCSQVSVTLVTMSFTAGLECFKLVVERPVKAMETSQCKENQNNVGLQDCVLEGQSFTIDYIKFIFMLLLSDVAKF